MQTVFKTSHIVKSDNFSKKKFKKLASNNNIDKNEIFKKYPIHTKIKGSSKVSHDESELKFYNFLLNNDVKNEEKINKLIKIENKNISDAEYPLSISGEEDGKVELNDRIQKINDSLNLDVSDLTFHFKFKDIFGINLNQSGDFFRVIATKLTDSETTTITIILLDIYHLYATSDEQSKIGYNSRINRSRKKCISNLFSD